MKKIFIILILLMAVGCNQIKNDNKINNENINENESGEKMNDVKVIINDNTYILKLENNKTVDEFINLLPQEYIMNELNNNEKYVYIDKSLTTNSYNPEHIEKGDVMLFGDNCIVIFYKSLDTTYRYTKIGHIDNLGDLGNSNIKAKFEK